MITQRPYIKSEPPVAIGVPHYLPSIRRSTPSSALVTASSSGDIPMKSEERLRMNELEKNAVKALLSLGEAFVSQSSYRTPVKKQPEPLPIPFTYTRPLQPHHPQQQQQQVPPARSVIVKTEPGVHDDRRNQCLQSPPRSPVVSSSTSGSNQFVRELPSTVSNNGLNYNNQATIRLTSTTTGCSTVIPQSSSNFTSPVSIQPVSAVSSSSPVISTYFYQLPGTSAGVSGVTTNGSTTGTAVMSPSFAFIPAPHGSRTVIPLPMVGGNSAPLVKLEPGTPVTTAGNQNPPMNWNNIQLVKVPRNSIDNSNGVTTFNSFTPAPPPVPIPTKDLMPRPIASSSVSATDAKPPKSKARRRSQNTTKGQSRSARVSSGTSDMLAEGLVNIPNMVVDGYEISREIWAKAFLQNDIIHAAGTLFNALFSSEEIKNCTLNGRNGTRQLCPEKRHAIFKIVAWMRNKCQDPYSFNKSPEDSKILSREEQLMIEKKVFVERRYQTSRKIRDLPPPPPTLSITSVSTGSSAALCSPSSSTPKKCATPERRDSGSFSTVCSSGDDKGIPKIAVIQSSEIIANYFQSAEPHPVSVSTTTPIHKHHDVGPPPMKMQKVG